MILALAVVALAVLFVTRAVKPKAHVAVTTTTVKTGTKGPPKVVPAKLVPVPPATVKALNKVAAASKQATKAVFKVTYKSIDVPGAPSQVSLEQLPPDELFRTPTAQVLVKGKKTYYCSTGKAVECRLEPSTGASPLGRVMALYTAGSYVETLSTMRKLIHTGAVYSFSPSRKTIAGLPSDCATWGHEHSVVNYCVTDKGVLTYFTIAVGPTVTFSIKLASYSSKVSPADFAIPTGAKVSPAP